MKKYLICLLIAILFLLGACSPSELGGEQDGITVVTTVFPVYDWLRQILGEDSSIELIWLLDNGIDMHSYQPSVDDIIRISTCDMLVYVGGSSDQWVEEVLAGGENPDMIVINLLDVLGDRVLDVEIAQGMEADHHHKHNHNHDHDHDHDQADEHIWLSLQNAELICEYLAESLAELEGDQEHISRGAAYIEELAALDEEYRQTVEDSPRDTLLFADRFPFLYLVRDYNLNYYAAFSGCYAETEASFETVVFLAGQADKLDLDSILVLDGSKNNIAQAVLANTRSRQQEILTLNSMQSVSSQDMENGITYLSLMEENLQILQAALN